MLTLFGEAATFRRSLDLFLSLPPLSHLHIAIHSCDSSNLICFVDSTVSSVYSFV